MASDKRWPWVEQVFTLAPTAPVHDYMARKLSDIIVLERAPIKIYEPNINCVIRGRREHMLIFYLQDTDVEGWLHYINSVMRGNITAFPIKES